MRVLLVEDEQYLADAVAHILKRNKYEVDVASDGELGLAYALKDVYDVIVLDNMLPLLSGVEILRRLREKHNNTPILMLSAKSETTDKVEGLNAGADDYLAKPFKTAELLARLQALMRRHEHDVESSDVRVGDLVISRDTMSVACGDTRTQLTTKEFDVLEYLATSQGKVVSKEALYFRAWGQTTFVEDSYVFAYVSYLRQKLKHIGSEVKITSVRRAGYRLQFDGGGDV